MQEKVGWPVSVGGDETGWNREIETLGRCAVSLCPVMRLILKRTSGRKTCVGVSVVQVVRNVREACWRRPAAKNFYCMVRDSLPGSGGGGSDAE